DSSRQRDPRSRAEPARHPSGDAVPGDRSDVVASFTTVDSRDLLPIAVVAQCLDNQWVSQDLLARMIERKQSYEDRAVARRRAVDARAVGGRVAEEVVSRPSTAVVRFVVAHHDRRTARNQLATAIDITRVKFARTGDDWAELIARLRASGLPVRDGAAEDDPAMNAPPDADES
ncbi:MAG TPA: hypothetical protein VFT95_11725, partial [Micromonosporaceae bacterium]|nr:hypothetical protein [Micromonosporaceae bacterium]